MELGGALLNARSGTLVSPADGCVDKIFRAHKWMSLRGIVLVSRLDSGLRSNGSSGSSNAIASGESLSILLGDSRD